MNTHIIWRCEKEMYFGKTQFLIENFGASRQERLVWLALLGAVTDIFDFATLVSVFWVLKAYSSRHHPTSLWLLRYSIVFLHLQTPNMYGPNYS